MRKLSLNLILLTAFSVVFTTSLYSKSFAEVPNLFQNIETSDKGELLNKEQIIRNLKQINHSILIFQDTYGTYPGDMKKRVLLSRFPNQGNNDGIIDADEELLFWEHLMESNLLKDGKLVEETSLWTFNSDVAFKVAYDSFDKNEKTNVLILVPLDGNKKGISSELALFLDKKMDDLLPSRGNIQSYNIDGALPCVDPDGRYTKSGDGLCNTIFILSP